MTAQPSFPDVICTDDLVRHRNGMCINPGRWSKADHSIITEIFEDDFYTLGNVKPGPATILDIGAHIGAFAVACHQRWPHAEIICVEPNPFLWSALEANTELLGTDNVWAAVGHVGSDHPTLHLRNSMTLEGSGGRCTASSRTFKAQQDGGELPVVPAVGLDWLFERCEGGSPDLLKIDCEGCECDILEHWPNLFLQCPHIRMEWHDDDTKCLALQLLGESGLIGMEWEVSVSHERDECGILAATRRKIQTGLENQP